MEPTPHTTSVLDTYFSQNKVLQGASEVFAAKGIRDTTIEDILHASNLSRRTFYKLFKNKDAVLDALYELASRVLLETIAAATAGIASFSELVEACIDAYLDFNRSAGPLMIVLEAEALNPDSILAPRRRRLLDALVALFDQKLAEERGKNLDPLILRGMLFALEGISGHLHSAGHPPADEELARAKRVMIRIVQGALAEEGAPIAPLPLREER